MMKQLTLFLGYLLIQHPLLASETDSLKPDWVMTPPAGLASACAIVSKSESLAKRIAVAKAMAELGRMRSADVQSVQTIEKQVINGQSSKSTFIENTRVTSEEALETTEIVTQALVVIDGNPNLCVLVGIRQSEIQGK